MSTPSVRRIVDNPDNIRRAIFDSAIRALQSKFPIQARNVTVQASNFRVEHVPLSHNQQKTILMARGNATDPIYADLTVVDNKSGKKILEIPKHRIMSLPYYTNRYTFLVDGNEYNVVNQLRTKSGVYTRRRGNDTLESAFNLAKGANFKLLMDPETGVFKLDILHSTLPLVAVLRALGTPENDIRQGLGPELYAANLVSDKQVERAITTLYEKLVRYKSPLGDQASKDEKIRAIRQYFEGTEIDPETTKMTLGAAFTSVSARTILQAAQKILRVYNDEDDLDERDNLEFQKVFSVEDFVREVMEKNTNDLKKIKLRLDAFTPTGDAQEDRLAVKGALSPVHFSKPIKNFIVTSSISRLPGQINPMEMVSGAGIVTRLGEGAISSDRAVPDETRAVNYSYMGVIDPVETPESGKIGIDNRFTLTALKGTDNELYQEVINCRTGQKEKRRLIELREKTLGFPDTNPESPKKASDIVPATRQGKLVKVRRSELDYQIPSVSHLGSVAVNSLPFVNANQANRIVMGSKHIQQALPLKYRDKRLVEADLGNGKSTYDEVGQFMLPKAPVDGTVIRIDDDFIYIRGVDGVTHRVDYEKNMPLATKTMLDNTITVKVGDKVKKGQALADSNFTKDQKLALGKNLRVTYLPYFGMNHEDGIVISESAAKKLTSIHSEKVVISREGARFFDKRKFANYFPTKFTQEQLSKLDEEGVVKRGQILQKGDPVAVVLEDNSESRSNQVLGLLHKSLRDPYRDASDLYEEDYPSEVIEVHKTGRVVTVLLKTEKPMTVGDKLCYDQYTEVLTDRGWVRISEVTWEDTICTLNPSGEIEYQGFTETHRYPQGGRMYSLVSQQLDMLVTDKHRNYVKLRGAEDFSLVSADEMFGKRARFKKSGNWIGSSPQWITLPPLEVKAGQSGNGTRWMPEVNIPVKTYMMLLGSFLSEGSLVFHEESGSFGIDICCCAEHKRDALLPALDAAGLKYTCMMDKGQVRSIRIFGKQLHAEFSKYGAYAHLKRIPSDVFSFAKEDLQILFDWMMWGDGHKHRKSGLPVSYTTVSKGLADDVQKLCLHIGIAANVSQLNTARVDTIAGAQYKCRPTWQVRIVSTKLEPQINHGHVRQQKIQVEKWVEDFREPVYCLTVPNHVMYVRRNGKAYWSGNSGTYGNKGVCTAIIPDHQMLQDESGKPLDVIFTSAGVIGRINPAQILESTLGKIADKTGQPYMVKNFSKDDYVKFVRDEMAKHKVTDKETLTDPVTGKKIPGVFVGVQHVHKLFKTTDSNYAARGVEGPHDTDEVPTGSGETGPKALGNMEINALISHNARGLLREGSMLRSSKNNEFWRQFQSGGIAHFPSEKKSFGKFTAILNQAGIKLENTGDTLQMGPLTDKDILEISSGEIKDGRRLDSKLRPEVGGLFDEAITGGLNGTKWGHVKLVEPVVNPIFIDCAKALLRLSTKEFETLMVEKGGAEIKRQLDALNLDSEMAAVEKALQDPKLKGSKLDQEVKRLKYLRALKDRGLKAGEAYVLTVVPVTPPLLRPISVGKTGDLMENDSNQLYKDLILQNNSFQKIKEVGLGEDTIQKNRKDLIDRVKELTGVVSPSSPHLAGRNVKGAIQYLAGDQPKHGYFQRKVIYSKMNLSGRATITPDNTLGMDEVGLPEDMAWEMYKPFIIRRLTQQGYGMVQAKEAVTERSDLARQILLDELEKRPVLINRAPTLWKYSIIAAKPQLRPGKSLAINTLWESGLNSDFDGDCILNSVFFRRILKKKNAELNLDKHPSDNYPENTSTTQEITDMAFVNAGIRYQKGLINIRDFPRIEESAEEKGSVTFYKVPEGIEVLTVKDGVEEWLPVESFHIHRELDMVECKTNSSRTVHCSTDHSLITVDEDLNYVDSPPQVGLVVPRLRKVVENRDPIKELPLLGEGSSIPIDFDLGYLTGCFIGDGWVNGSSRPWDIMLANVSDELCSAFSSIVKRLTPQLPSTPYFVVSHHDFNGHASVSRKMTVCNRPVADYFRNYIGHGADKKHLPEFWMHADDSFRWGLLSGLIDTDGTVSKVKAKAKSVGQVQCQYSTNSRRLAFEIVALAESLDLTATCGISKITESGNENWYISFTSKSLLKMQRKLRLKEKGRRDTLASYRCPENLEEKKYTPPLSEKRVKELCQAIGAPKLVNKDGSPRFQGEALDRVRRRNTLYTSTWQTMKKGLPLTKNLAKKLFSLELPLFEESEFWAKWKSMVLDDRIEWEVIKSITPIPEITEAYDLTVPPAYTMVTECGWVVQDSVNIHLPVQDEAIEDAKKMLPSQLVFSERKRGDLLYAPSQEPIVGLFKVTQNLGQTPVGAKAKKFRNVEEAWKAYYDGSLKATDLVEIG